MSFLPIVERELRVRARLKNTYRLRMSGALVAMLVVGFMLILSMGMNAPNKLGLFIFNALAWLCFLYCLLEGARTTADCLSEEKRAGTLGLLFLTDLKGYDVVLGKMMATSLNSFYALLAVLPLLGTPLLLGGVTAGEFWRLALVLVNTFFLSLAVGLLVSALFREARVVWSSAYALLGLLAFYPWLVGWFKVLPARPGIYLSPAQSFNSFTDTAYHLWPWNYWGAVLGTHLFSWVLLLTACWVLPRAWQERVVEPAVAGVSWWRKLWPARVEAPPKHQSVGEGNPVQFLAVRGGRQQVFLWLLVAGAAIAALVACAVGPIPLMRKHFILWGVAIHIIIILWVAAQASFVFGETRNSGGLELLMATPLSVKEIILGHFEGLRKIFFGPVLALILFEVGLLGAYLFWIHSTGGDPWSWVLLAITMAVMIALFILDLYAVGWFGLYMGLCSKKPSQALSKTITFVLALPLVCGIPCYFLWPILGLTKDLVFMSYAQNQLRRRFRYIVTEQFATPNEPERPASNPPPPGGIPPLLSAPPRTLP